MIKILNRFVNGTLSERVALIWTGLMFVFCIALMVSESGPFLWLADLQADYLFDGTYRPRLTFAILWTVTSAPALVIGKLAEHLGGAGLLIGAVLFGVGSGSLCVLGCVGLGSLGDGGGRTAIAVRDVAPGEILTARDVDYVFGLDDLPVLSDDAFGRIVRSPLLAGEPVFESTLVASGKGGGVASLAPAGSRVLWLVLDEGVAGLSVSVADRVDLYETARVGDAAVPVATNVPILAVKVIRGLVGRAAIAVEPEAMDAVVRARDHETLQVLLISDLDVEPVLSERTVSPLDGDPEWQAVHAAHDLAAGQPIQADDLVMRPGMIDGLATDPQAVIGRVPQRVINAGQPISEPLLADAALGWGIAALTTPGMRAISVSLGGADPESFHPGAMVDVFTVTPSGPAPILEQTAIVAFQPNGAGCPCAIIEASPEVSARIVQARAMATLAFRVE